jgi:hypothetical protein
MRTLKKILLIFLLIVSCTKQFEYEIADQFFDRSKDGAFLFMFIEVNELNASKLIDLSIELKLKNLLDSIDPGETAAALIHYYIPSDTIEIPENKLDQLKARYKRIDVANKLNYIPKGVIYSGYAGKNSRKDTIFVSDMFIPKKAFKAKEIFIDNANKTLEKE